MATRVTGQEVLAEASMSSKSFVKGQYLDLKLKDKESTLLKRVRIIGYPIAFYQCTDQQWDKTPGAAKGDKVKVPFPDAELNKSYTRIMREETVVKDGKRLVTFENDPWFKMGYIPQLRYAVNCIDRDTNEVCILTKGKMLFEQFAKQENQNIEANNEIIKEAKDEGVEVNKNDLKWVISGGEFAPDFKIKVSPSKQFQVSYEIFPSPKAKSLSDEDIEKLRDIGAPTAEEIKNIREEDTSLKGMPDWFLYGYPLDKIFKPTEVKTESKKEEVSFGEDEIEAADFKPYEKEDKAETPVSLDDDEEVVRPAKKKAAKVVEEEVTTEDIEW